MLAAEVHEADRGDTSTVMETLVSAIEAVDRLRAEPSSSSRMHRLPLCEVVLDKGYHGSETLTDLEELAVRSYVSAPRLPKGRRRRWKGKDAERRATAANRRRIRGKRGKELMRRRGELLERPFAHELESGGLRRTHVRGRTEVRKRISIQAAAANIGLLMRTRFGIGAPKGLQGCSSAVRRALETAAGAVAGAVAACAARVRGLLFDRRRTPSRGRPRPEPPSPTMWVRRRQLIWDTAW